MKKWMNYLFGTVLCMAMAFGCTGCAEKTSVVEQKDRTQIVFSWWGNDNRHEYTIKAVKEFEKKHPQIKVVFRYGDWNGFEERTDIEIASRTEADVMQINYPWLTKYSPDGTRFYDLYRNRGDIDLVSFSEEEEQMGTIDGRLNALPTSLNSTVFYWNKTILDSYGLELPKTWDDLFVMAEKMVPDGICPLFVEPKFAWALCTARVEQQTGKKILNDDGSLGFSMEDIQAMLEFYCELREAGVIDVPDSFERSMLSEGKYAGTLSWVSSGGTCCEDAAANGYEMAVGDFLTSADAKRFGWYYKPAQFYVVSANTEHPKEAVLLMHFLLNSEEMALNQKLEKGVPVSDKAYKVLKDNNLLQGFTYDGYQKMEEKTEEMEWMSPYFENDSWIARFCTEAEWVTEGNRNPKVSASALYKLIQGQG